MNPSYEPIHNTATAGVNRRALPLAQEHKTLGSFPPVIDKLGFIFADIGRGVSLVGGPVHDVSLGLPIHDFDLTTLTPPEVTRRSLLLWDATTWDVGREFGTIRSVHDGVVVEVITYRSGSCEVSSRKPRVDFSRILEGDLSRHDFTVNATVVQPPELELIDPCGGLDDLADGVLRIPVITVQSFDDDPLRIMRATRFAAQLGFNTGESVMSAMAEMTERLAIVPAERIRTELERFMLSLALRRRIGLFVYTGMTGVVLPEIAQLRETADEYKRHRDVYKHTLTVIDQVIALEDPASKEKYEAYLPGGELEGPGFTLRSTALSHDIGKPRARRFEKDGSVTFRVHDVIGARMVAKRVAVLRFDKQMEKDVTGLVEPRLHAFGFSEAGWTDSAVRCFIRDAGDLLPCFVRLIHVDATSRNRRKVSRLQAGNDEFAAHIRGLAEQEAFDAIRPDPDGARIMEILGLKPESEVSAARNYPLEFRLDEGPLGKEEAEHRLLAWWSRRDSGMKDSVPATGSIPGEP